MTRLEVSVTLVNASKGYRFYESGPEPAHCDTLGDLYRRCRSDYGRCVSKMYRDGRADNESPKQIGWVFQKRVEYEDSRVRYDKYSRRLPTETYLQEAWINAYHVTVTNPFDEEEGD